MSPRGELSRQVRDFASRQAELLNRTVTHGIRLTPLLQDDGEAALVGYQLSRTNLTGEAIPLTIGAADPSGFLRVVHTFRLDDAGRWLMNVRETFGLYADPDFESVVCHYDYDRDPDNAYPSPHLQVGGDSPPLDAVCAASGADVTLARVHFPVGGRRFRPALEDLVEVLILEGMATGRPGWEAVVEEHRAEYHRHQLAAAVRRDPDTALRVLREEGHR